MAEGFLEGNDFLLSELGLHLDLDPVALLGNVTVRINDSKENLLAHIKRADRFVVIRLSDGQFAVCDHLALGSERRAVSFRSVRVLVASDHQVRTGQVDDSYRQVRLVFLFLTFRGKQAALEVIRGIDSGRNDRRAADSSKTQDCLSHETALVKGPVRDPDGSRFRLTESGGKFALKHDFPAGVSFPDDNFDRSLRQAVLGRIRVDHFDRERHFVSKTGNFRSLFGTRKVKGRRTA